MKAKRKANKNAIDVLNELLPGKITSGEVIKAMRSNFGITLKEISEITGISANNLSDLEKGKKNIGLETAIKIGLVLGLHPITILYPNGFEEFKKYREIIKKSEILMLKKRAENDEVA